MNRILVRDKEHLNYTSTQLSALAKNKMHNIRSNYNQLSDLVFRGEYAMLKKFLDYSANYFTISLNNWDNERWTLHDEIELLNAYYESEKALGNEVDISINCDLYYGGVRFIPEVLTTLLNNSILHAFKNVNGPHKFFIKIQSKVTYIEVVVSDNGKPSPKEAYLRPDKPNKGLSLLAKRISNESYRYTGGLILIKIPHKFIIEPIEGKGTMVTFHLPTT